MAPKAAKKKAVSKAAAPKANATSTKELHTLLWRGATEEDILQVLHADADVEGKHFLDRWSPLQRAVFVGDEEAVATLLRAGASPNTCDSTVGLFDADDGGKKKAAAKKPAGKKAPAKGGDEKSERLPTKPPQPALYGGSPIHVAATLGFVRILKLLLDTPKADPNVLDKRGRSPLLAAAAFNKVTCVQLLLAARAREDAREGDSGRNALQLACVRGATDVVRFLVGVQGHDIAVVDKQGQNLLDLMVGPAPLPRAPGAQASTIARYLVAQKPQLAAHLDSVRLGALGLSPAGGLTGALARSTLLGASKHGVSEFQDRLEMLQRALSQMNEAPRTALIAEVCAETGLSLVHIACGALPPPPKKAVRQDYERKTMTVGTDRAKLEETQNLLSTVNLDDEEAEAKYVDRVCWRAEDLAQTLTQNLSVFVVAARRLVGRATVAFVKQLLEWGADVNAPCATERALTARQYAQRFGDLALCSLLGVTPVTEEGCDGEILENTPLAEKAPDEHASEEGEEGEEGEEDAEEAADDDEEEGGEEEYAADATLEPDERESGDENTGGLENTDGLASVDSDGSGGGGSASHGTAEDEAVDEAVDEAAADA